MKFKTMRISTPRRLLTALCIAASVSSGVRGQNEVQIGYGEGGPGENDIEVIVTASNDVEVHGYSVAFSYPSDALELVSTSVSGTHIAALEPEYVGSRIDNDLGLGSMGVILTLSDTPEFKSLAPTPEAGNPRIVARLTFDVLPTAVGGVYPLRLLDGIGVPAQFNRFSSAGESVEPTLIDGEFRVTAGSDLVMLDQAIAFPGASRSLPITAFAQHRNPLDGFQIAFTYEKDALQLNSATTDGTSLNAELGRSLIELFSFEILEDFAPGRNRATVAVLFDGREPFDGQQLSPNPEDVTRQSLIVYRFDVLDGADSEREWQELVMDDEGRAGLLGTRYIFGDSSVPPNLIHGKIYFSQGTLTGITRDCDSGQPVSGVLVRAEPDGHLARSDATGRYTFEDIPPGDYTLRFSKLGHYPSRLTGIRVEGKLETSTAEDVCLFRIPTGVIRPFVRGYINPDSSIDVSDAIFLLQFLFQGTRKPTCQAAADVNDDNGVDIADAISLLTYLFANGREPASPFGRPLGDGTCDDDPTPGDAPLSCEQFNCEPR